ncbi:Trehalose-6-P synthase/phosphatase complex subunit [Elasticomyces elasticus]|nr:Trehalose-6-P synthase/phosphatase complex subunit [Elasticomyces elasticus]
MSTFVVSLFLPYTVDFHHVPTSRRPSPPARKKTRKISFADSKTSATLFSGPTPPLTPTTLAKEEFFSQFAQDPALLFPRPHDPRALVRSDAHVGDWGKSQYFNQPKSRAGALPSGSILDYAKVKDLIDGEKRKAAESRKSPRGSHMSREQSHERLFEGKTWTVEPAVQGNGGLTNAIRAVADAGDEMEKYWVGTLGFPTDALVETQKHEIHEKLESEYDALTVFCSDSDLDGHYAHYCKTILWPVFHYQIPDHPKSKAYEDHSYKYYVAVNQTFADKIVASYKRGDIIWIHDYHLLLVPGMIRKKLPDAQIGFFLHTAFPSSEVFRCLSTRNELLEGMLGANLVAFQTREYAQHFLQTCSRLLIVEATNEGVQLEDHFVNVTSEPIGIDPHATSLAREEPEVKEWINVIREKYKGKRLIVARDKLDHVRGVRQKLLAYELFLNKYPEWRDKVVLIQVATSTTEQSELLATVSDIVNRIESCHSTLAHQPLVFLKQDIAFSQYLALLTVADVLMITSLREGMNLTSHEYIFCQDGKASPKKHGPLILSEFTGSASVFNGGELSVNPWDYQKCAEAIKLALIMDDAEKENRHKKLLGVVTHQTGGYWASKLIKALAKVHEEHYTRQSTSIPRLSMGVLAEKYKAATSGRVFVLDYEGTLASYGPDFSIVLTSPQRVLDTLNDVLLDSKNIVYVMSARKPEELERLFRQVPRLGIIAENGCFVRPFAAAEEQRSDWVVFADLDEMAERKTSVRGILQYYHERLDGSWIEERHCSLVFHYDRAGDLDAAARQAGDCANHINDACEAQRVHAVPVDKAVLIESTNWSKGTAATHIFDKLREELFHGEERVGGGGGDAVTDFLMVAGDDREDEVIFRWANALAAKGRVRDVFTVSVGKRNSEACATLTQGTTGLLTALQKLAKISLEQEAARKT